MKTRKVWLVTGASKGLGLTLVKQLLESGYLVAATSRKLNDLLEAIGPKSEQFLPLAMDLKTEASVAAAVENTFTHFGQLDVVVNNAGYGLVGTVEELSDWEARENFEVNVFGTLNVIRRAMPYLREQRSGHIFNLSSIGGFNGHFPGFGIYCGTKFAIEGLSESLAAEVKPFGIDVTIVAPGYFRTDFLSSESLQVPKNPITAYKQVRDLQDAHQNDIHGNQAGDPVKAAQAMIRVATEENPPLHLFLGEDAYNLAYKKIDAVIEELEQWKALTVSTAIETSVPV